MQYPAFPGWCGAQAIPERLSRSYFQRLMDVAQGSWDMGSKWNMNGWNMVGIWLESYQKASNGIWTYMNPPLPMDQRSFDEWWLFKWLRIQTNIAIWNCSSFNGHLVSEAVGGVAEYQGHGWPWWHKPYLLPTGLRWNGIFSPIVIETEQKKK